MAVCRPPRANLSDTWFCFDLLNITNPASKHENTNGVPDKSHKYLFIYQF